MNSIIISAEEILSSLSEVMDPEIPALSIVDLGIIEDVLIEDECVTVKMLPTFTACPAIKMMQQQVREKVLSLGFENVNVIIDDSVAWNSDRITEEGKIKLEKFGLGIPNRHGGEFSLFEIEHSKCPHCSSEDTTMNSLFGSTLCRSIHFCFSCRQSFERFKPL
ncbi:MAG: 1,2-phenylacetyl-CoA epoxidase subunit PaaD [Chitinophagales bacterium]